MARRCGIVLVHTNVLYGEVTGEFEQAERDGEGQKRLDATASVLSNGA